MQVKTEHVVANLTQQIADQAMVIATQKAAIASLEAQLAEKDEAIQLLQQANGVYTHDE